MHISSLVSLALLPLLAIADTVPGVATISSGTSTTTSTQTLTMTITLSQVVSTTTATASASASESVSVPAAYYDGTNTTIAYMPTGTGSPVVSASATGTLSPKINGAMSLDAAKVALAGAAGMAIAALI